MMHHSPCERPQNPGVPPPRKRDVNQAFPTFLYNSNTMRWSPWASKSDKERDDKTYVPWQDSLNATDWAHYKDPRTVGVILAAAVAGSITTIIAGKVYRSSLRRIPEAGYIKPTIFRKKSLFGTVTRVGDGDNFHLFHQPGGRLMGWGWLPGRMIPVKRADLRGNTV